MMIKISIDSVVLRSVLSSISPGPGTHFSLATVADDGKTIIKFQSFLSSLVANPTSMAFVLTVFWRT